MAKTLTNVPGRVIGSAELQRMGRPLNNAGIWIRAEVEYVRTETVVFDADPNEGFGTVGAPTVVARVLRALNYYMHRGKSLTARETPKLLGWRILLPEDVAKQLVTVLAQGWRQWRT